MPLTKSQIETIAQNYLRDATNHKTGTVLRQRAGVVTLVGNKDIEVKVKVDQESQYVGIWAYSSMCGARPYQQYLTN